MADLEALAVRAEQATGPDRELDLALAKSRLRQPVPSKAAYEHTGSKDVAWAGACGYAIPAYTASIDAALTLVPEGWAWALSHLPPFGPTGKADAVLNNTVFAENAVIGTAATPALAICAAALRAKANQETK